MASVPVLVCYRKDYSVSVIKVLSNEGFGRHRWRTVVRHRHKRLPAKKTLSVFGHKNASNASWNRNNLCHRWFRYHFGCLAFKNGWRTYIEVHRIYATWLYVYYIFPCQSYLLIHLISCCLRPPSVCWLVSIFFFIK